MKSLSSRLLLFNILILFLPLGSLLLLDTYENQLLASQENSMIQQGRIFSSALSGRDRDLAEESRRILENLRGRVDSRIRVVDSRGNLLADSAALSRDGGENAPALAAAGSASMRIAADPSVPEDEVKGPNDQLLYRMGVYPVNLIKKLFLPPPAVFSAGEYYSGRRVLLGPEIQAALENRYGAATRYSSGGQVSVNLYSAIPVEGEAGVIGAVLVSRSSYGILLNLYRIRLDIITIFLISLGVSLLLSLGLSFTITLPIKKLKREAEGVLDKAGHFSGHFRGLKRKDEIGDLSRSLAALSLKLEKRIAFIETFTSDLLHELKNPLAAIRGQAELSLASPGREEKLLGGILQEERRMERLLARLRELSRIDNTLDREAAETVDLGQFLPLLLEGCRKPGLSVIFENDPGPALVRINPDRLTQALVNPLDNAVSFSPPGGTMLVKLETSEEAGGDPPVNKNTAKFWRVTIDDQGPGIREESGEAFPGARYFERFYSERPQGEKENHSGLGLSIVRTIAEGYGGRCSLANRYDRGKSAAGESPAERRVEGCRFVMILPAAG